LHENANSNLVTDARIQIKGRTEGETEEEMDGQTDSGTEG